MPKEHEKIKYLPGEKSLKAPFTVYVNWECLLQKMPSCKNNPKNSRLMRQKTDAKSSERK